MPKYIHGSEGACVLPSGFNARLNTWSATLTRNSVLTTGFGASFAERRASKVIDITGSAGGFPIYKGGGSAGADNFAPIKHSGGSGDAATALDDRAGGTIILFLLDVDGALDADAGTDLSLTFDAVFSSYDFGVTQDGESTVTFNFEMNDADGPSVTWDES